MLLGFGTFDAGHLESDIWNLSQNAVKGIRTRHTGVFYNKEDGGAFVRIGTAVEADYRVRSVHKYEDIRVLP